MATLRQTSCNLLGRRQLAVGRLRLALIAGANTGTTRGLALEGAAESGMGLQLLDQVLDRHEATGSIAAGIARLVDHADHIVFAVLDDLGLCLDMGQQQIGHALMGSDCLHSRSGHQVLLQCLAHSLELAIFRRQLGVETAFQVTLHLVPVDLAIFGLGDDTLDRPAQGFGATDEFDPFLLFDDFRNDRPEDFRRGFPWHPHRGIETITYVLAGTVEHGDSLGNQGMLGAGDLQWMTAGSGILHQEMPKGDFAGRMHGFQLWANLPSSLKMTKPRYQDIKSGEIPVVVDDDGTSVRVICGDFWGKSGPVDGIAAEPVYLDISVPPGKRKTFPVDTYRSAFAYIFAGSGSFRDASKPFGVKVEKEYMGEELNIRDLSGNRTLVVFDTGDEITVQAGEQGIRFLLVTGKPIKEPVAWHGPIVMNTREELMQAMKELQNGTFIKADH